MKTFFAMIVVACTWTVSAQNKQDALPEFTAVHHASLIIRAGGLSIFVDPVGDISTYAPYGKPDLVLITHEHGDHLDIPLLKELVKGTTEMICTSVVKDKTGFGKVMKNNDRLKFKGISIEAIPAYNTTPERLKFHPEGVGNGYVLTIGKERIYISGDTEDIPEMRKLKNIDHAFICMNLPYTMDIEQAASALKEMKPANVYPYHYRNQDGSFSDINVKLRELLSPEPSIRLHLLKWY